MQDTISDKIRDTKTLIAAVIETGEERGGGLRSENCVTGRERRNG